MMKKLTLSKETLRSLDDQELTDVVGGGGSVVCSVACGNSDICNTVACQSAVCSVVCR